MSQKNSPYTRFWEATLASIGAEEGTPPAKKTRPPTSRAAVARPAVHQLMGRVSVAGNIIIVGDAPAGTLEMILNSSPGTPKSPL